jgi:hypothetical protein
MRDGFPPPPRVCGVGHACAWVSTCGATSGSTCARRRRYTHTQMSKTETPTLAPAATTITCTVRERAEGVI